MAWQLWVAITLLAALCASLAAQRIRRAHKVFDEIVQLDRDKPRESTWTAGTDYARTDALGSRTYRHRKIG
ncbi:hypothetical protein [Kribbella sp. NPDC055071]